MWDDFTAFWISCCIVILGCCAFGTYSGIKDNEAMLEMVKAGADPQKAACAVRGSTELNRQVCHVIAAKYGN